MVVVIGAGMGGLAAAIDLARRGMAVTVLEREATPGGKLRQVSVDGVGVDAGPTVFTMRWVLEELFADAGAVLADAVGLRPAPVLARHAWVGGGTLDLFADAARSEAAIGAFAGAAEARGYRAFAAEARTIYETLEAPFLRAPLPSRIELIRRAGARALWRIRPFETMWQALARHFRDERLLQLFGRYATYCGSSPFLAPATLMLVAHVERMGVWFVEGGMIRLAEAMAALAMRLGVTIRYGASVAEVLVEGGRAVGALLESGERIGADSVISNADPADFADEAALPFADRSLSAATWAVRGRLTEFPALHHTVFFSDDYAAEFRDLRAGRVPEAPTVYVCAQDRETGTVPAPAERFLCLINAPADPAAAMDGAESAMRKVLERCGATLEGTAVATGPAAFARLFPGSMGALYGRAVHGSAATFRRPGARSRIPGLYRAGGHCHPGAGIPMAVLSGRLAASALMADRDSIARSRTTGMRGGTWMR